MFTPIYFDHNGTTPIDPRVLGAMLPYLKEHYGNASSRHEYGRAARRAIDQAREQVAASVGAHATEVIFVSCGSEANNLMLKGAASLLGPAVAGAAAHVAISSVEHPSVRDAARSLARRGWKITEIAVDAEGRLQEVDYARALLARPRLISVVFANNETGVLQDIPTLAERARAGCGKHVWFHSDAIQALGKVALDFRALNESGVHALTVSAHKIYGPKGAAALIIDKRVDLAALISGGGQERGLRSGTENVAAIVGFGRACELAVARLDQAATELEAMRKQLERGLGQLEATVFGQDAQRLPNTVFFAIPEIDGETLVAKLDRAGFAVASGSACSSASTEPSHVLLAMGVAPELARGAVRVSLGMGTTSEQVAEFLATLAKTTRELKHLTAISA